ncbi:neck passage structure protein [Lactococcus phage ASCC473]|uniref:Neck passage structure protein n=1 Tax=Lactococcus phage ASCC473 TaxID=1165152 RepID=H9EFZ8_9CAUD|nr:neck passage structure protein [Lactococcus phage ASCC473]
MSLDNFKNRTIIWDTVNKDFPQPIQIMQGDVNARTLSVKIIDNGGEIDLTGHSLKLTYQYTNSSNSGFVMIPPENLTKGEFILVIPTEMTETGVIEANLILLNEDKEQVIVSKNLTFISDNSTVSDLAQEVNNNIDDFTKLLLENMPQVMRSELNDLHIKTDSNTSNIERKANLADVTNLRNTVNSQGIEISTLENKVSALSSGVPKEVSLVSSMTDKTKSYVYTGTEPGYTPGNWYYWNGTIWAPGGTYQATAIDLDVDGIRIFTPSKTTGAINPFNGTITTTEGVVYYTVDVSNGAEKLTFYSESFGSNYGYAFYNGSGAFIPGTGQLEKFEGYQTIDVPVSATTFRVTSRLETNQNVTLFKANSSVQKNAKNINDNFVKSYGNKKLLKSKDYQHVPLLISSTTGRWVKVNNSSAVLIPISDVGKAVKIMSNALNSSSYTFLKTATGNSGDLADFATSYKGIKKLSVGEYATLQVPSDAGFLYVTNSFDDGSIHDVYPKVTPMLDTIVTVAASNSSALDKSRADYVATGANDQDVINQAITSLVYGGTIKLFDGDYNIDAFGDTKTAIYFPNNGYARTINFEGSTENKSFLSEYGVTIHVTKTAFDSLPTTGDYNVFAGDGTTLPIGVWQGFANNVNFKNFYLKLYTSQRQMVGINGQNFGSMYIEQVGVYSESYFTDRFNRYKPVTPAINSIGIISVGGANDEMARIGMDTVNVGGLGTGIIIARAEHLIVKNSTVSRSVIGYKFSGNADKPLTLINNADEGNTHLPVFKGTGLITSIDFSIERLDPGVFPNDPSGDTNPFAKELTPGGWKGTFDFNIQGSGAGINHFWQSGSGRNIKTKKISSAISGTVNPSNPEYLQEFFRTDLNKKLTFNGNSWVDSIGNIV